MGHQICALVAKVPINKESAKEFGLSVYEENGFAIVGIDSAHSDYWADKLGLQYNSDSEIRLDCPVTHIMAKKVIIGEYALIETEYFGGAGNQKAGVFEEGEVRVNVQSGEGAINECLRTIGVRAKHGSDEFDTINLAGYRSFEDEYEEYYDV